MKSVSAQVVSSKPISLAKASKILSNFVSVDNGASHAVSVYLCRAATSFVDLNQFHKDLKSASSSRSHKRHYQIIAFDFEQDEQQEIHKQANENNEVKKKKKRKGDEIDAQVELDSPEQSKKKRRKTEGNR